MSEKYQQLIELVVKENIVNVEIARDKVKLLTIEEVTTALSWFSRREEFGNYILPPPFLAHFVKTSVAYLTFLNSNVSYGTF